MNFLESAEVLLPALTGLALTIYDGSFDALKRFEGQYCFSPQLQQLYTAQGLKELLRSDSGGQIYDLSEPLGTRLAVLQAGSRWLLVGPYVEEGWGERSARALLAKLGIPEAMLPVYKAYWCKLPLAQQEFAVKAVFLLSEHLNCGRQTLKTIQLKAENEETPIVLSDVYANANEVNRRYQLEDRFIAAVSQGDVGKAHRMWGSWNAVCTGIRFMSDSMQDQLAGAAICRTLIRTGAKLGGLSPVLIDSISQEYAQKMKHTASKEELLTLAWDMTARICGEVDKQRRTGWSPAVRRAADYMRVNLSKPMTMAEVARAAGVDRHQLSKDFARETGKTVKQYLAMRRCEVAAELLLDSGAGIQEIAAYVGYMDANYFSKVFKANQGVPPQAYRTAHRRFR